MIDTEKAHPKIVDQETWSAGGNVTQPLIDSFGIQLSEISLMGTTSTGCSTTPQSELPTFSRWKVSRVTVSNRSLEGQP
jgi:hypothetical protein